MTFKGHTIMLGRLHTKTGLVTQKSFMQTCFVQTRAVNMVKACRSGTIMVNRSHPGQLQSGLDETDPHQV